MENFQPIYDIAEVCAQLGVNQAILCPGSRCAPLTLAFVRHSGITSRTFSDERSAAFTGLGIAQQTNSPTILVCTSGSAAYNFAPAVAEAWYNHVPLIVFTADRPAAWIDQNDGQAIRQKDIYGGHVKGSWTLPEDYSHKDSAWHIHRIVMEAVRIATEFPSGPVHINAPFREPFYPAAGAKIAFTKGLRIGSTATGSTTLASESAQIFKDELTGFDKILIVAGQGAHDIALMKSVEKFVRSQRAVVVGDVISNFHSDEATVRYADSFLANSGDDLKKSLQADLLITFGRSVISKSLKLFLRKFPAKQHWHLQPAGAVADTFQSVTKVIRTSPASFFEVTGTPAKKLTKFELQKRDNYITMWSAEEHKASRITSEYSEGYQLTELHLVARILENLPKRCNLHLSNSMSVRYANYIALAASQKGVHVFANRGTSGIDGCTSTTVGHTLASDVPNILITGDLAFFYDRNAFWHKYAVPNLRVLLLNNHGGIIFSMIDGPGKLPEKEEFFVTKQSLTAESLANEYGVSYLKADHPKKLKSVISEFLAFGGKAKILELESPAALNLEVFENFKKALQ